VVVVFEKVPQAVPLHDVPDMLQLTPSPLESFATLAVKFKVCPWSMDVCVEGVRETDIRIAAGFSPPQPHKKDKVERIRINLFMMTLPPGHQRLGPFARPTPCHSERGGESRSALTGA
jgi:hypothetical protein